jgi:SAM-dependent methyltransferase
MEIRGLAKLALDRDIGHLKTPESGYTIGIGETGIRKNLAEINIGLPEWEFPKDPIPAEDGKVSIIHCYHFLEHLTGEHAILFLKEVQRVLREDGILQFGVPYYKSELAYQDLTHKSFWTESSFKMLMNNPYYDPETTGFDWQLKIQSQCIIGVVGRNLMLIGQLIKKGKKL